MMHELKYMKTQLMDCVKGQLSHLETVDAKELGEVVDMIKDIAETEYYCSIVKAMEEKEEPWRHEKREGKMYYPGSRGMHEDAPHMSGVGGPAWHEYPMVPDFSMKDYREGRSGSTRKMYMEHKELHHPKEIKMKDLENYMHELSTDITEMISDASPEEKQLLKQKLTTLATKLD